MSKYQPLESASKEELLTRYDNGINWLDTHACQSGTNNTLDINGDMYNPELYENCCKTLEKIEEKLDLRFPGWRENREVDETVSAEKLKGFENGYFKLGQLNPSEQLKVIQDAFPGSRVISEEEFNSQNA